MFEGFAAKPDIIIDDMPGTALNPFVFDVNSETSWPCWLRRSSANILIRCDHPIFSAPTGRDHVPETPPIFILVTGSCFGGRGMLAAHRPSPLGWAKELRPVGPKTGAGQPRQDLHPENVNQYSEPDLK